MHTVDHLPQECVGVEWPVAAARELPNDGFRIEWFGELSGGDGAPRSILCEETPSFPQPVC